MSAHPTRPRLQTRPLHRFGSARVASWRVRRAATSIPERPETGEPEIVPLPDGEPYATVNAWHEAWSNILDHYDLDELPLEDFGQLWRLRGRLIRFGVMLERECDELLRRIHSTWCYCDDGSDGGEAHADDEDDTRDDGNSPECIMDAI